LCQAAESAASAGVPTTIDSVTDEPWRAAADASADKRMKLRYAGTCRLCGTHLPAHAEAVYERATRTVRCITCAVVTEPVVNEESQPEPAGPRPAEVADSGIAGSSARREYERRKAKDEERLRDKWGRFGGLAVALSGERQSTKAWERGAVGEERLGARLDSLASAEIAVLHDRRIPGTRANIDHIVVTKAGIWVIDAKRYKGRPELKIEGGILRPRVEKLLVGRRDCTELVDGVIRQVELVRDVVGEVPVTGALCFVEAGWPLIGGSFTTRNVHVLWPKRLAKALAESSAGEVDVAAVRESVATRFKSSVAADY
jgi:Nuclease-related domain